MQAKWLNDFSKFTKQNSPAILSGVAIIGVGVTAVLAARAATKAQVKLHSEAVAEQKPEPEGVIEKARIVWPLYIPAALSGGATIACIVAANQIGAKRLAAMGAAYSLVERSLREYKEKVLEEIGEDKERKIGDAISEDRIRNNPPVDGQVISAGTDGKQLCYEQFTGRYFRGDIEGIRRAENDLNARMLSGDMSVSLNEFYELVGLGPADIGAQLGWNVEHRIECIFSSHLRPEDGIPCLAIRYREDPFLDYAKGY